jgi:hypothetical protein
MVSAGSELAFVSGQRICTYASQVGDEFTAVLSRPVSGTNGIVIPKGATAVAHISSLKKKSGTSTIGLNISSVTFRGHTYPVSSNVTYAELERMPSKRRTSGRTVAAGTGVGAVLGGVVGGPGTAVLGAAGGAAAGAAMGTKRVGGDGCIPDRGVITAQLTEPLEIGVLE